MGNENNDAVGAKSIEIKPAIIKVFVAYSLLCLFFGVIGFAVHLIEVKAASKPLDDSYKLKIVEKIHLFEKTYQDSEQHLKCIEGLAQAESTDTGLLKSDYHTFEDCMNRVIEKEKFDTSLLNSDYQAFENLLNRSSNPNEGKQVKEGK